MTIAQNINYLLLFFLFIALSACDNPPSSLEKIQQSGELRIVSRNGPTTWYTDAHGTAGIEYELSEMFADFLGVKAHYSFSQSRVEMLRQVTQREVDFAAAGITITDEKKHKIRFTLPYQTIKKQWVYRKGTKRPHSISDVIKSAGMIAVETASSEEDMLNRLKKQLPELHWHSSDESPEQLLKRIQQKTLTYTLANSHEIALNRRYLPDIAIAFDLGQAKGLAWAFRHADDSSLYDAAVQFFEKIQKSGKLQALLEKYYGHIERLNYVDSYHLQRKIKQRLPKYQILFEQAGLKYQWDWMLLAAVSYQESHWNPKAVSPTGVRGLMMLTLDTAKQMGVKNRTNAEQSINGGAKYLSRVRNKIPSRITEPDRTWLTLAAYNIGFGHLEDARILAQRQGANPDLWLDVKKRLPLLAKKKYFSTLKYGYARGGEALAYVENIRNYYDMLNYELNPRTAPRQAPEAATEWWQALSNIKLIN